MSKLGENTIELFCLLRKAGVMEAKLNFIFLSRATSCLKLCSLLQGQLNDGQLTVKIGTQFIQGCVIMGYHHFRIFWVLSVFCSEFQPVG